MFAEQSVATDGGQGARSPLSAELLASLPAVRARTGQVMFRAGDKCTGLLLLQSGTIRVQLTTDSGRQVTLYRVVPGEACVLSTQCLMTGDVYRADGIAETDIVGRFMPAGRVEDMISTDPAFRRMIFSHYGERLIDLVGLVEGLLGAPVESRLAQHLLDAANGEGIVVLTHQAIAADLGTAREVVSRHLKQLERRGFLRIARGRISLVDRAALRAVSQSRRP
jgi:CRP/FNR family transcriptional regulator